MLAGAQRLDRLHSVKKNWSCDVHGLHCGIAEGFVQRCPYPHVEWSSLCRVPRDQPIKPASGLGLDSWDDAPDGDVADSGHNPIEHVGEPLPCSPLRLSASKLKAGQSRPSVSIFEESSFKLDPAQLLLGSDCVFRGLGDAELDHGLGLDLNGLACLRVTSYAGLAVRLHQTAEAGDDKHAVLFGVFDGDVG